MSNQFQPKVKFRFRQELKKSDMEHAKADSKRANAEMQTSVGQSNLSQTIGIALMILAAAVTVSVISSSFGG